MSGRELTAAVTAELGQKFIRPVLFLEAWFASGPLRLCTLREGVTLVQARAQARWKRVKR